MGFHMAIGISRVDRLQRAIIEMSLTDRLPSLSLKLWDVIYFGAAAYFRQIADDRL